MGVDAGSALRKSCTSLEGDHDRARKTVRVVEAGSALRKSGTSLEGGVLGTTEATAPRKAVTVRMDVESVEYRVITEDVPSELFSSGTDARMETSASTELEKLDDGSLLINNMSAMALNEVDRARLDIQRVLEELGIRVNMADQDDANVDIACTTSGFNNDQGPTLTGSSEKARAVSRQSNSPEPCVPDREEQRLLKRLFGNGRPSKYVVRDKHMILGRVMHSIFRPEDHVDVGTATDELSSLSWGPRMTVVLEEALPITVPLWKRVRTGSRKIINNPVFSGFFLALTLYSLFSLDLVVLFGTKDIDEAFWIVNSVVFILFLFELVLWSLGVPGYILTMPFLLDLTALLSVYGDTWFMRKGGFLNDNEEASRLSRMARTSKMTRLARIVRVARITKLIPELLRFLRKQNTILARQVLLRRLWRVFLFLDTDEDGLLSSFDVKVFYISVIQDCPHVCFSSRLQLLQRDVPKLEDALDCEDESSPTIDFETFSKTIERLELGRNMVNFHLQEVEQEEGVWTLTQRLSDRTAMKVCVGILVLITMISFLEVLPEDQSVQITLAELTSIARQERLRGAAADIGYICDQIGIFVQHMMEPHKHKVLFLYLDGLLHFDAERGGCLETPDNTTNPILRAEEIRSNSESRDGDFTWICWPGTCIEEFLSASLVDQSVEEQNHSKWAVVTILMVITLLLIFVYGLNQKIRIFSGKLLQPLQTLLDDMTAMACLELVHLDREMPGHKSKQVQVAEELEHLQTAFKGMRSAIRSWAKYVPPCIVERLFLHGIEATVGVARCHATILFVDIVDFEAQCSEMMANDPQTVLHCLTNFFGCVSDCISKRSGVLLEFIGHEVLAVFNTPSEVKCHALAGVLTALEIHSVVKDHVMTTTDEDKEVVVVPRCGVHTGNILAGNIGSHRRMKYGLLGDGINLAARLKGLNSRYHTQTLCSAAVLAEDNNRAKLFAITRPVDCVAVKGKSQPTTVHEVIAQNGPQEAWLSQAAKTHAEAFELYQARRFQEAMDQFAEVSKSFEKHGITDEPSRLLQQRCVAYLKEPPPADWDGVDRLTKKTFDSPAPVEDIDAGAPSVVPRVVSMTAVTTTDDELESPCCSSTMGLWAMCDSGAAVGCGAAGAWSQGSASPAPSTHGYEDDGPLVPQKLPGGGPASMPAELRPPVARSTRDDGVWEDGTFDDGTFVGQGSRCVAI